MVQFLSINFFSWISSIFVGFFVSSRFFVSPCIYDNPSDRTIALGLTRPLTEMSTRNNSLGKGGQCVRLTLPSPCASCFKIWEAQPPGTLWACPDL